MSKLSGKIQTVLGPIDPTELGITMAHEHLVVDVECNFIMPEEATAKSMIDVKVSQDNIRNATKYWTTMKDNTHLYNEQKTIEELYKYRLAGGGTIVDVTSIGIGRDPLALARISRATELNIVMGGSYYVPLSYPEDMDSKTEDSIYEGIVEDIVSGVSSTEIKTGVIGEIGNHFPMSDNEAKVLRASARAQIETGAPILIHPGFHKDSPAAIMKTLLGAGANPDKTIVGHLAITFDLKTILELAKSGCYLEFDTFGIEWTSMSAAQSTDATGYTVPSDNERLDMLEYLINAGYEDRILLAQDNFIKIQMTEFGGKGYAHILENIVPRMKSRNWPSSVIDKMLIQNPSRAFSFI